MIGEVVILSAGVAAAESRSGVLIATVVLGVYASVFSTVSLYFNVKALMQKDDHYKPLEEPKPVIHPAALEAVSEAIRGPEVVTKLDAKPIRHRTFSEARRAAETAEDSN